MERDGSKRKLRDLFSLGSASAIVTIGLFVAQILSWTFKNTTSAIASSVIGGAILVVLLCIALMQRKRAVDERNAAEDKVATLKTRAEKVDPLEKELAQALEDLAKERVMRAEAESGRKAMLYRDQWEKDVRLIRELLKGWDANSVVYIAFSEGIDWNIAPPWIERALVVKIRAWNRDFRNIRTSELAQPWGNLREAIDRMSSTMFGEMEDVELEPRIPWAPNKRVQRSDNYANRHNVVAALSTEAEAIISNLEVLYAKIYEGPDLHAGVGL